MSRTSHRSGVDRSGVDELEGYPRVLDQTNHSYIKQYNSMT